MMYRLKKRRLKARIRRYFARITSEKAFELADRIGTAVLVLITLVGFSLLAFELWEKFETAVRILMIL